MPTCKLGHAASVSFSCAGCGVQFVFYGDGGGPYLQGVIDGLLADHAGHDFDMIESSWDRVIEEAKKLKAELDKIKADIRTEKGYKSEKVQK